MNCIVINPDNLYRLPTWVSYSEWANRYNIAYWFWELETFPAQWKYALPIIDEIWVNTEFNARAMRAVHPRVTKIPFAIAFDHPSERFTRQYFGLPLTGFCFLNTFDFHSSIERKNPQACIEAFLKAFPNPQSLALLIIKSINADSHPQQFEKLRELAKGDTRIIFIDRYLSPQENLGLLNLADCYLSLHRSEGLGLGMAESMYLGKPVIATAYSGNLEFMNETNAYLIPYTLVPVHSFLYAAKEQQYWAKADIEAAAIAMIKIQTHPNYAKSLGEQAQKDIHTHHSLAVMGQAIKKRLQEIGVKLS
jgi:glycosyltransferase involved in cell wall biosynthesis